jgi:hypothetical protein
MTPKEKANKIFTDMYNVDDIMGNYPMCFDTAKKCALIAVDEIINTNPQIVQYISDKIDPLMYEKKCNSNTKYWQEVKAAIKKL